MEKTLSGQLLFAGESKIRPARFDCLKRDAARRQRYTPSKRFFEPIKSQKRNTVSVSGRAEMADLLLARQHRNAGFGSEAVVLHADDAGACAPAVLHARHNLLAYIASFFEINPVELIHVGFVGKCVAVGEVEAAPRNAELDPMLLV